MLSTRLFPLSTFGDLRGGMDRVFDLFPGDGSGTRLNQLPRIPAMNAWEDDDNVVLEVEAPGIPLEKLDIDVLGRDVTVSGTREDTRGEDAPYSWRERSFGRFSRSVKLDVDIDSENVKAVLKDGVLTITLPKAQTAKARRIAVTPE